jgi:hypothetical protein
MTTRKQEATAATVAMKGGGYYSESTRGAKDVIDRASILLMESIDHIEKPANGRPVQIADMGAADGGTSKETVYNLVRKLKKRWPEKQIVVTYTDLPSNDYSQLFKNMAGMTDTPEFTYTRDFDGVFVHGSGTSFHQQILSDESLDIGFSATAMHWISDRPCMIDNHVHMVGAKGETLDQFAQQAATDWERILLARAREMAVGGRFAFVNFCIDEQGRYLGNTGGVNMFDTFHQLWAAMHQQGKIGYQEYIDATFPQFYRTPDEFAAPMMNKASAVYKAGLRLVSSTTALVPCPYRTKFDNSPAMSPRDYAVSLIPTMRSWSETVFKTALDEDRSEEDKTQLVDEFYQSYEDLIASDPDGHAMDYIHCYMMVEKIK